MTPLFTPLKGEVVVKPPPPLAPREVGGERVAAAGESAASPATATPPSPFTPLGADDLLAPTASSPPPRLPDFGGVAARTGVEEVGWVFSLSEPPGVGGAAAREEGAGGGVAAQGEGEEEGCQRSWMDCSSSRHSDGFVRQKLRRPSLVSAASSFFIEGLLGEQARASARRIKRQEQCVERGVSLFFKGRERTPKRTSTCFDTGKKFRCTPREVVAKSDAIKNTSKSFSSDIKSCMY